MAILVQTTFDPLTESTASMESSLAGSSDLAAAGAPLTGSSVVLTPDEPPFSGRLHVFHGPVIFSDRFESGDTTRWD